jgi:hypothetical protein
VYLTLGNASTLIIGNASTLTKVLHYKITAGACSEDDLRHHLGLFNATTGKGKVDLNVRPIEVFMCSVKERAGYGL